MILYGKDEGYRERWRIKVNSLIYLYSFYVFKLWVIIVKGYEFLESFRLFFKIIISRI